ncbi:MAG: hypothetical protein JW900_11065 [Anaerolineae bacterium]|nr:hypothetical protein [Anaerolineae bacterium]
MNRNQTPVKTRYASLRLGIALIAPLMLLLVLGYLLTARIAWASPDTYYVSPAGHDGNDCRSVAQACRTVQAAIDRAAANDEVYVAQGAYTDDVGTVVWLTKSLLLQGGWNLGFTENDPVLYPTRLDARQGGPVVVLSGTVGEAPITPTVAGFIISGGDGTGVSGCIGLSSAPAGGCGGGIFGRHVAPRILNNVITGNVATRSGVGYGGGICLEAGGVTGVISGNIIVGNVAAISSTGEVTGYGGGINLLGAPAIVQHNEIVGNVAAMGVGFGGGIAIHRCAGTVLSNTVQGNRAGFAPAEAAFGAGGGIYVWQSRPPFSPQSTIGGNQLRANVASIGGQGAGGGIVLLNAEATIDGNWIVSNTSAMSSTRQGDGGGIFATENVTAVIANNHILGNTSSGSGRGFGGGMQLEDSQVTVVDNRVAGNVASRAASASLAFGGGINLLRCSGVVQGNRVEGNAAAIDPVVSGYGGGISVRLHPVDIEGNIIVGNTATRWGGGVRVDRATPVRISNNVVVDNAALVQGDGIHVSGSGLSLASALISHNTLVHNSDGTVGEGVCASGFAAISMTNNILVSHTVSLVNAGTPPTTTFVADSNLLVADEETAVGPVTVTRPLVGAPAFVDPGNGDYHIQLDSAARDAGTSSWVDADVDGDPRPCGAAPDAGVDEIRLWGAELGPDRVGLAPPGQTLFYPHTLTNTGNYTDTFSLAAASSEGWTVSVEPSLPVVLGPGSEQAVAVTVTIPGDALSDTVDTTAVTATSQSDGAAYDVVLDRTTVQRVVGVEFAADASDSGLPGSDVDYVHFLTNTGNSTDTFDVTPVSSQGWIVTISPSPVVQVGPGAMQVVTVTVGIPGDALSGTVDSAAVTALSRADGNTSASLVDTTVVNLLHAPPDLVPLEGFSIADPGCLVVFTHTLFNNSNVVGSFALAARSPHGWPIAVSAAPPVPAFGAATVALSVTVPGDAPGGLGDTTVLTASGAGGIAVALDTVRVRGVAGVSLAPDHDVDAVVGETVRLAHTLANLGNITDTFAVFAASDRGWPVVSRPASVILPAGGAATVWVTITVPGSTLGLTDTTVVSAASQAQPDVVDTARDVVAVTLCRLYLPLMRRN